MSVEPARVSPREIAAETVIAIILGCPHEVSLRQPATEADDPWVRHLVRLLPLRAGAA